MSASEIKTMTWTIRAKRVYDVTYRGGHPQKRMTSPKKDDVTTKPHLADKTIRHSLVVLECSWLTRGLGRSSRLTLVTFTTQLLVTCRPCLVIVLVN